MPQQFTYEIITAAIAGFEAQKSRINSKIAELRNMLGHRHAAAGVPKHKRGISAAARRRMALAQKKRWAVIKGRSHAIHAVAEAPKHKRRISAASRRRMALAQKKRWAVVKGRSHAISPARSERPKRRISEEGMKRIIAATKRRWALKRALEAKAKRAAAKRTGSRAVMLRAA